MGVLLSSDDINRAIKRISHEIIEHNQGAENIVLLGIPTRGAFLAQRIGSFISEIDSEIPIGVLDVTLHRDDLRIRPPKPVQLAVLVDRGHRELPIRADYVGKNIPTALDENVKVHMKELDGDDLVELIK